MFSVQEPRRYRKRPVVIEAMQNDGTTLTAGYISEWAVGHGGIIGFSGYDPEVTAIVYTLEGGMVANVGDYIIKGVNDEFYPCKPDIFEKTHDLVEDDE